MDRILNSQKLIISKHIINTGLEPSMFKWDVTKSMYGSFNVPRLNYIGTNYFFTFEFMSDKHYCIFSPGVYMVIEKGNPINWIGQMDCVKEWLKNLKREVDITDPWDDIGKYMPGGEINLEDEKENLLFSYEQVEHITNALHKLKDEIRKSYNLDTGQDELVQEKLDYLIDRSKKMGRIDWKNLFVGTLMGLAGGLAFNPEQAKGLWGLVKICFKGILLLGGSESG